MLPVKINKKNIYHFIVIHNKSAKRPFPDALPSLTAD